MLQLLRLQADGRDVALAIKIVDKYFDEFTKKHYEKTQRGLNISDDEAVDQIDSSRAFATPARRLRDHYPFVGARAVC